MGVHGNHVPHRATATYVYQIPRCMTASTHVVYRIICTHTIHMYGTKSSPTGATPLEGDALKSERIV